MAGGATVQVGGKPRRLCTPVGQRPDGDEYGNQDPHIFCHGEAAQWSPVGTKAALRSTFLARRSALDEQEMDCLFASGAPAARPRTQLEKVRSVALF